MDDPSLWLALILILLFGGYFSLAETAFAAADPIRIKVLAETSPLAKKTLSYLEAFDDAVIITVIGSNISSVVLSTLSTIFFIQLFQDDGVASLFSTIIAAVLFYIFCDTIPKVIARALPNQMALLSTFIFGIFKVLFFPLFLILRGVKSWLNRFTKTNQTDGMTEEDFSSIVEKQHEQGTLDQDELALIQSAIEFSEKAVKDVLTPIEKIYALKESDLHQADLPEKLIASPFSRIPIYRESLQHIVGVLSVRTYFQQFQKNRNIDALSILKKPYLVSSKISIDDLFEGYKKYRTHVAIVVDANQVVIGMVTMEDVLEEIMGQLQDASRYTGVIRE
jgi:putative hemolysin